MTEEARATVKEKADAFLKASIGLAILLAGVSIAYYYVIYIPTRDAEAKAEVVAEKARAEKKAEVEKAATEKKAEERRTRYEACKGLAQSDYNNRWNASCAKLAKSEESDKQNCLDSGMSVDFCESAYKPRPATGCMLPSLLADNYAADLSKAKDACLADAKSDL